MGLYYMGIPSPPAIIISLSILLVLDVGAVAMRFVARKRLKQRLQMDDWLTIPSLVISVGMVINMLYGVGTKKLAYPLNIQSMEEMPRGIPTRKHEYVIMVMAPVALALVKLCCIFLYRRIFVIDKTNHRDMRNLFFAACICVLILWGGGLFLPYLFICKANWYLLWGPPWEAEGKCLDYVLLVDVFTKSDFITDVLVLLIPIPFVWTLHLPMVKKFAVIGVFLLGTLASIASFLRMLWMVWSKKVGFDPSLDEAIMTTFGIFWITLEVQIGLLASCLPTLGGIFRRVKLKSSMQRIWSSRSNASSSQNTASSSDKSFVYKTESNATK